MKSNFQGLVAIRKSYTFALANWRPYLLWSVPCIVVSLAGGLLLGRAGNPAPDAFAVLAFLLPQIVATSPTSIWAYRRALAPGSETENFAAVLLSWKNLRFIGAALVLSTFVLLGMLVGGIAFSIAVHGSAAMVPVAVALPIAGLLLFATVRLIPWFPLIALDFAGAFRESMRLSKGRVLRMSYVLFAVAAPATTLYVVFDVWLLGVMKDFMTGYGVMGLLGAVPLFALSLAVGQVAGLLWTAGAAYCVEPLFGRHRLS